MLEGELIKRQVQEDLEKERQKERARLDKLKNLQEDQKMANEEQLRELEIQKLKDKEEERKIAEFAKQKEALD